MEKTIWHILEKNCKSLIIYYKEEKKMTIGLIIAAGTGSRMGHEIPKQFINVDDKPVLLYTLENFQKHPEIDEIVLVILEGWGEIIKSYAKQYNIDKLKLIINGGSTGQESIRNGVLDRKS